MKPVQRPGPGQRALEGVRETTPQVRNLGARNVFSEVATAEYWDLDLEDFGDIDDRMIEAAAADKLRSSLIDVSRSSSEMFVVGYTPEGGNRERYVPLSPGEYKIILKARSPKWLGQTVMANTLSGKKSLLPSVERRQAEAEEDELNAIERKLRRVSTHLDESLASEKQMLERLLEAAHHPGLQRRTELDTRVAVSTVLEWTLPQALEVVGRQRGWKDKQYALALQSIKYRLFFMRSRNQHLRNWVDTLSLLRDYDQEKINVFADRGGRLAGYLLQHGRSIQPTA